MNPPLVLAFADDYIPYNGVVKFTIVPVDESKPNFTCNVCDGGGPYFVSPVNNEKKYKHVNKEMVDGRITLDDVTVGCLSGVRGHKCAFFRICAEFIEEKSQFQGYTKYSRLIEVCCKTFVTKRGSSQEEEDISEGKSDPSATATSENRKRKRKLPDGRRTYKKRKKKEPENSSTDDEELLDLNCSPPVNSPIVELNVETHEDTVSNFKRVLLSSGLEKYISFFEKAGVTDEQFWDITEQKLISIGVNRIGPRLLILNTLKKRPKE